MLSFALSYLTDSFHSTFPLHSCFPLTTQENEEQWVCFAEDCICKRIWFHFGFCIQLVIKSSPTATLHLAVFQTTVPMVCALIYRACVWFCFKNLPEIKELQNQIVLKFGLA